MESLNVINGHLQFGKFEIGNLQIPFEFVHLKNRYLCSTPYHLTITEKLYAAADFKIKPYIEVSLLNSSPVCTRLMAAYIMVFFSNI